MIVDYFARQGQTDRLRAFAKSELQKDAKDKDAWALLGECDMMEEKWDDAIRDYEEAVKTGQAVCRGPVQPGPLPRQEVGRQKTAFCGNQEGH